MCARIFEMSGLPRANSFGREHLLQALIMAVSRSSRNPQVRSWRKMSLTKCRGVWAHVILLMSVRTGARER